MATWKPTEIIINGNPVKAQAPLIVSASRSTDIPAFYADWFFESVYREGEKASEKTAPAVTEDSVRAKVQRLMGTAKTVTVNYYSNTADNRKKYIK